jgi:hypothetical protein
MFEKDNVKKDFREDLKSIKYKIENKEPFSFSKYADGELHILINKPINNGEFWFIPKEYEFNRDQLIKSFKYKHENYFVGVSCPCCIGGKPVHKWMKEQSSQDSSNLTWANIFVNGNHEYYLNEIVPLYSNYDVCLVSNSDSNLDSLPFKVKKHFMIGKNAWVENHGLIDEIKNYIDDNKLKNNLFLFCAGPFGNLLSHQLFDHNKENTYIDIGSTLNTLLLGERGRNTRGYLKGEASSRQICVWGNE